MHTYSEGGANEFSLDMTAKLHMLLCTYALRCTAEIRCTAS